MRYRHHPWVQRQETDRKSAWWDLRGWQNWHNVTTHTDNIITNEVDLLTPELTVLTKLCPHLIFSHNNKNKKWDIIYMLILLLQNY